jgi:hypothetical protein
MKRVILAGIFSLAMLSPAYAFQCPTDMAAIDAALASNTTLSDADRAKVQALRAEGEALHKAGKHTESVETLAQAKAILGLQ